MPHIRFAQPLSSTHPLALRSIAKVAPTCLFLGDFMPTYASAQRPISNVADR